MSGRASPSVLGRWLSAGRKDIGTGRIADIGTTVRPTHEPEPCRTGTVFPSAPQALLEHFDDVGANGVRLFLQ